MPYEAREFELADVRYKALINLFLLATKLQDIATANTVLDQIGRLRTTIGVHPGKEPMSIAYQSTVQGSPLRKLLLEMWFYKTDFACRKRLQESDFPTEFLQDMVSLYE